MKLLFFFFWFVTSLFIVGCGGESTSTPSKPIKVLTVDRNASLGTPVDKVDIPIKKDDKIKSVTLKGDGSEKFAIDKNGEITTKEKLFSKINQKPLQKESKQLEKVYDFQVVILYGSGKVVTIDIQIKVYSYIEISRGNNTPVANNQIIVLNEDAIKAITLSSTDADGDSLTYTITSQPTHGILSGTAPNIVYTPTANYFGSDIFSFKVNDGTVDSNLAKINLSIQSINDKPLATSQSLTMNEDSSKAITLSGIDSDGDSLTYTITSRPTHGTLSGMAPNVVYTPTANYFGSDTFSFKVNDGTVNSNSVDVKITIVDVEENTAPIFTSSTIISVNENQTSAITLTATDSNGDTLTYSISGTDANSFNIDSSTGVVTFKVEADYETKPSYSFIASVSDGIEVATQTVTITIIPALIKNSILKNGYTIKETTRGSYVIKDFSSYIGHTAIEEESKIGYITLSDYGAVGDGITDDTASLKEALNESRIQNKPLYIPNGIYKITEIISLESGDSILGADKAVIYADNRPENAYFIDIKGTSANPIENVTIENIIFYKVAINLYITDNIQIKNNTFLDIIENNPKHADYHTALTVGSVSKNITIDGNEFLNTVENRVVREISLYNTQNVIITNNHFGIQKHKQFTLITDFNNLKTGIGLISKNVDTTIEYNRIVGSTYSPQDGDGYTHKDHAIYFKKYNNVLFKYNMVGGWPTDASGGLKLRNTTGKGEFSNNELYNIGFITYIYPTTEPRAFINQTFKDNTFFVSETPTKSLIFYWGPTWAQINTDPNGRDAVTEENAMAKDITISGTNIYYNENFNQSSIIHTRFNICSSDSCNYTDGAIREGSIGSATYQSQKF